MFIAALFTIAKTWKQPKCPRTDEQGKEDVVCMCTHTHTHTHTQKYYLAIENETMPFAAIWMGLEIIILNEASQKETNTVWYHLYVESKI